MRKAATVVRRATCRLRHRFVADRRNCLGVPTEPRRSPFADCSWTKLIQTMPREPGVPLSTNSEERSDTRRHIGQLIGAHYS